MTIEATGAPEHDHSDAWPHDDTHHVVAAFALLLIERGAEDLDQVLARLAELQVARGKIDRDGLDRLIADLERAGLVTSSAATPPSGRTYELTAKGRGNVVDWSRIMRDRRRLSRTFLALYDRADE